MKIISEKKPQTFIRKCVEVADKFNSEMNSLKKTMTNKRKIVKKLSKEYDACAGMILRRINIGNKFIHRDICGQEVARQKPY